jgi:hypothetical protein
MLVLTDDQGAPGIGVRDLPFACFTRAKGNVASPARDGCHVEPSEDRFLWLTVEQEPEGRLETALWGYACGPLVAPTSLATS